MTPVHGEYLYKSFDRVVDGIGENAVMAVVSTACISGSSQLYFVAFLLLVEVVFVRLITSVGKLVLIGRL